MGRLVDVLVVGAGPAGCSAARAAAEEGANVLMIEKRGKVGEPVQCAEYVPRLLTQHVKIPSEAIAQEIKGMITFMPDGKELRKHAPGFILNRAKFDQALAMEASRSGAKILTRTTAISRKGDRVLILGPSGEDEVQASVVIGADGPDSLVGSWIGQKNKRVIWAMQHTVVLKQPSHDTEVYFSKEYPGGYAWLFPKGEAANIGVGIQRELGKTAKQVLNAFRERIKDRIGKVLDTTAGRIPVGGSLRSTDKKARIILVGDAAGHTHPITGGGIPQAVICGAMAGRAAAAWVRGNQQAFEDYDREWKSAFGPMMDKAVKRRKELETGWNRENFAKLVRRCWVACREYYHDS
jgi:geranylgeranyl reductase family protein